VNQKLTSRTCEARDIAELLRVHAIGCAILGACKSAQADADVHANLSWALIRHGRASNVLAMSFNMPDSMSEKFFKSFYVHFLLNGREFAEAASMARLQLFTDRNRRHYNLKRDFLLQDWFVPVVYSNGTRLSLRANLSQVTLPWTFLGCVAAIAYIGMVIQWLRVETRLSRPLLGTFSCSPPLSLVPLRWILQSRQQERLSDLAKRLDSEKLAMNILRVEGDLKRANAIFFYCSDEMRRTVIPFLDGLLEVWKRTQFVERHNVVHAEWFLETGRAVSLRHGWRWLFNNACHNVMKPYAEMHGSPEPRSVVIVKNIHILYPERAKLKEDHLDARNRMFAWLEANFGTGLQGTRPYLMVVVGGTRYWDERRIGQTCQVLRSAARTEFATRYG
jgi:CHAT domain